MSFLASFLRQPRLRPPSAIAKVVWREEQGKIRYTYSNDTRGKQERRRGRASGERGGSHEARCDDAHYKRVEHVFIGALLQASSCQRRATLVDRPSKASNRFTCADQHRRHHFTTLNPRRNFSSNDKNRQIAPAEAAEHSPGEDVPRERYRELADFYSLPPSRHFAKPKTPQNYLPLAPRLFLTSEQESRPPYGHTTRNILPPIDGAHAQQIDRLRRLLKTKYINRGKAWRLYRSLPTPRPRYVNDRILRTLLKELAVAEFKDLEAFQRFFALLDECLGDGVELTATEWNTAISLAGRWVKETTKEEVKTAVETWMRMENAGHPADNVTFNILFDVAIRAGRFALAETIYGELHARKMPITRYLHTSMIYYAGLRGNGDAVRQAFRDFVNSGHIVDTAVMNCVIRSLVWAGEAPSAEIVFDKMKCLHATKFGAKGPRGWRGRRELGIQLHRTTKRLDAERELHESSFFGGTFSAQGKREEAQRAAPIHPDGRTYQILIRWHALQSGNLGRVKELLAEMQEQEWNVHGSLYSYVFYGFWRFGGHAYAAWTRASLEGFWEDFLHAMGPPPRPRPASVDHDEINDTAARSHGVNDESVSRVQNTDDAKEANEAEGIANEDRAPYFTVHLASHVIYAFYRCAGSKKMLQIWAQIQERWPEMQDGQRVRLENRVARLVEETR